MEQQGKATGKITRAHGYIVSLWPALPFMGFGFCAAWNALAQGTAWLSPIETNGIAVTNLTMVINIAMGLSLLVMGILGGRMAHILTEKRLALTAGVAATLASLVLLLIGPAYFQRALNEVSHMVFQICAVVLGLSFALLYLRFGMLYARLPLRRAVLYLCYANLLGIFSYLAVQASPMWAPLPKSPPMAFMIVFIVLPLFACATLCLDANANPWTQRELEERSAAPVELIPSDLGSLRRPLVSFSVALFLFAFAQSAVTVAVVTAAPPASTLATSNADMLVRIPLVLAFALLASTLEAKRLNFGRLLVVLASLLETVVLLGLVVGVDSTGWLVPVRDVVFGFQTLTWCMIFAVAGCHRNMSFTVVACAFGSSALGMGLGSLAGSQISETLGTPVLLVICALALLPCFMLLDNRSTEGLFSSNPKGATSLEELLGKSLEGGTPRSKGDFRRKLDDYAAQRGLSAREAETLRYLVAGRGDSQIAEAMGISYNTARTHVRNVFTKLDVHDRQTLIDVVNNELG